jgi:hypothetical protein
MFSISRSRYSLLVQFIFLALNAVGVFLITIYNASTPDLYRNNAHHKLGWILTWVVSAQVALGVVSAYARHNGSHRGRAGFTPVSAEAMDEHERRHNLRQEETYRFSNDSGQGTEPNTESLRSQSISSNCSDDHQLPDVRQEHAEADEDEKHGLIHGSRVDKYLSKRIPGLFSSRVLRVLQFFYDVVDRLILILGFVGLTTGMVTYGGLFVSQETYPPQINADLNRSDLKFSVGLRIGSRVEFSSGMES